MTDNTTHHTTLRHPATTPAAATASAAAAPVATADAKGSSDPRTALWKAVALAGATVAALAALPPERLDGPTPCPDYTVRRLSDHLLAGLRRIALIGRGGDPLDVPAVADDVTDGDREAAWETAAREAEAAWSDPAILSRPLHLPFGILPGAAAAAVFTTEFTLHTWDLATATGLRPAWDPEMLAGSLAAMRRALPAEPRGGRVPFAAVVEVDADAGDIDRLVSWYGRKP
ncbi:TIGR03086 family metal-binding protein [Streptomyces sp. NPDC048669]|uniref:TIGR03086 family metal-binding protein n=1 Tax=Streptomyces sp. NPDC048669 TaxID=3155267 RepID=UPI0034262E90